MARQGSARKVRDWVPGQDLQIGRLAWLAAYPELRRRSTPWFGDVMRVLTSGHAGKELGWADQGMAGWADDEAKAERSERLAGYSVAVDQASEQLSVSEQQELRQTGALPSWFFDTVEKIRRENKRGRR